MNYHQMLDILKENVNDDMVPDEVFLSCLDFVEYYVANHIGNYNKELKQLLEMFNTFLALGNVR